MRFALFTLEEPPHFNRNTMGSRVHAERAASRGELPDRALVFDSIGYFDSADGTQRYPVFWHSLAFGERGDFLAFIADDASGALLREGVGAYRANARVRSEGVVLSRRSRGASWSDHASFWAHDVPALLVTDTAAFRDPHYHEATDDGRQIDFVALARVAAAMEPVLRRLAR